MVVLLVAAGLYFSIRTRFVQVRRIGLTMQLLFSKGRGEKKKGPSEHISSFQAFTMALSGRVGTGNIVGVATAIAFGGPGSVFWMWMIAFLGASTAFMESTLSQIYRFRVNGGWRGGPAAYIDKGLKMRWLGIVFAIFTIFGYGIFLMAVQSNSLSSACQNAFSVSPAVVGIILVVLLLLVTLGGMKRIARLSAVVTPFMGITYILMAFIVLGLNYERIPATFLSIFKGAFGIDSAFGGMLGSTIAMGVKRGLFSNEAGEGGGAIISAVADVDHPAKQGLVQAFSVYIDTLLVCTCTALMILCTGQYNVFDAETGKALLVNAPELGNNYVLFTQSAINQVFNGIGNGFIALALFFFVYTTLIAYTVYADASIIYLCRVWKSSDRVEMAIRYVYLLIAVMMIVFGSITTSKIAWTFGDIGVGLTTWINVIALFILCPKALKSLKDLESQNH